MLGPLNAQQRVYSQESVIQMKSDNGQRKPSELVGRGHDGQSPSELAAREVLMATEGPDLESGPD